MTLPSPFRAARSRLTVATEALTCAAMAGARSLPPAASAESSSRSRTVTSTHGVTAGGASSCVACSVLPEFQQELLTDRKFGSGWGDGVPPGVGGFRLRKQPERIDLENASDAHFCTAPFKSGLLENSRLAGPAKARHAMIEYIPGENRRRGT